MVKHNVLITGASGYLGTSLVKHFLSNKNIGLIVGTDIHKPSISSKRFIFENVDIRDKNKHIQLLKKYNISQVFHFAFVMGEVKDQKNALAVNIGGAQTILKAVNQVKTVKRIIFSGSVSAYGANKFNKLYLKENHPLKANTLRYGINKKLMEKEIIKTKPSLRKDLQLVLLRICTIVGPTKRKGGTVATFLASPCGMSVIRHECPVQFVHEEDLLQIFDKILAKTNFSGIYNVAPKEYVTIKELSKKLRKPVVYIPYSVLYFVFYLIHRLKPSLGISENSVSYLTYPIIVNSSKIENELNMIFKYSSLDAFINCAKILQKKNASS